MTEHEVEVKAVLLETDDRGEAEELVVEAQRRLANAGAGSGEVLLQRDIYLSHPCRDLSLTDEAFRVRCETREGELEIKLTYKGPKVSGRSKARFEKEVGIANTTEDDLLELLSRLGFNRVMTVSKSRKRFHLDGIEIDLDVVEGLGVFCEMEIVSDDIRTAEERILDMMRRMGWSRFERRSYLEMLLSKQF